MPVLRRRGRMARRMLPVTVVIILWLVSVTAASRSVEGALRTLAREKTVALNILRMQLGDIREGEDELPLPVRFVLRQSPLLYAGRDAVAQLRSEREREIGRAHV